MMLKEVLKQFSPRIKRYLLILIGSASWLVTMIKSGLHYDVLGVRGSGIGFWGANGHDGIWHIALSESLSRGSWQMPIFSGESLKNYHIGFDLLLALTHKITGISIVNLYFQLVPVLMALLIGLLTYKFVYDWQKSESAAFWSTFFVYFGGSFGWVLGRGESAFWSQQSVSTLINPPFALSLVFILWGLILLAKINKNFTLINYFLCVFVFGFLIEIKAYAGVLVIGALFVTGAYSYIINRSPSLLKVFMGALLVSAVLYLPFNINASKLMIFQPFWFLESMMGLSDRVNFTKFYSAMLNYKSGNVWGKGILAYGVAFLIFILGNFGSRIIFIIRRIKLDIVNVFIYSIILAGLFIPMLFVQSGTPWNTIQFFYYSLFMSAILAGIGIVELFNNPKLNNSLICIVKIFLIIITIPTTYITLKDNYVPSRPPAMLGEEEISALNFLSVQPEGIVLTKPFDYFASKSAESNPPRPLYLYTSTAYVSAFSKHQTFLEDEINLDITGYKWQERKNSLLSWYGERDIKVAREYLVKNNIKYIYWIKSGQTPLDLLGLGIFNIYENDLITIYRVD